MNRPVEKSESEWREQLGPERYAVLREAGTERAFTGDLLKVKDAGMFVCAGCGAELFASDTKFESGSGWPSFWAAASDDGVEEEVDRSHGMVRTEVRCGRCGGHLGHKFPDGPQPTGDRYCINSLSLEFAPSDQAGDGADASAPDGAGN